MRLLHLQGARFLCAFWVLCGRLPQEHGGIWALAPQRLAAASDVFLVLSGFVAQWQAPHEAPQKERETWEVESCALQCQCPMI